MKRGNWHVTIKVWYLLFHEILSYLKKWKVFIVEPFNTFNGYCIPDGKYTFILAYLDQLTESVVFRPCKTKKAKLYSSFGISSCSLGDPAFCKDWMAESSATKLQRISRPRGQNWRLCTVSPDMDRAKVSKETTGKTWMQNSNTSSWSGGLKFVQIMKNHIYHSGIIITSTLWLKKISLVT